MSTDSLQDCVYIATNWLRDKNLNSYGERTCSNGIFFVDFSVMTRFNDKTDTSIEAVRAFAERLRKLATQFEYQADSMEQHGLKRIRVTHWKSVRTTIDGLGKFAGAIQEAITDATVMNDFDAMINNPEAIKAAEIAAKPKKNAKKKAN